MDTDRIMRSGFSRQETPGTTRSEYTVTVQVLGFVDGEITGTASPNPPAGLGLVCNAFEFEDRVNVRRKCSAVVPAGTQVTLTATPSSAGTRFGGWGGSCAGTGTCIVTMDRDHGVTAGFVSSGVPQAASGFAGCGDLAEAGIAGSWSYAAAPGAGFATTLSELGATDSYRGQHAVRANTNAAFDFALVYTAPSLLDVSGYEQLRFAMRALNTNLLVNGSTVAGQLSRGGLRGRSRLPAELHAHGQSGPQGRHDLGADHRASGRRVRVDRLRHD